MKLWEFKAYIDAFAVNEDAEVEIEVDDGVFIPTELTLDYGTRMLDHHKTLIIRGTQK